MSTDATGVLRSGTYHSGVRNKPAYTIESVDHALRLAVLLREEGPLRVSEAAARLGVARSTAHRLLAMLVYREFAVQEADRRYVAGPVLRPVAEEPVARLREAALPHLRELVRRCGASHRLVTRYHIFLLPMTRAMRSGDGEYHLCLFPNEDTPRCFYAPQMAY